MAKHAAAPRHPERSRIMRNAVLFALVAAVWWIADRVTKSACGSFAPGDVMVGDIAGLFDFQLVHNTGAAWGILGDSTALLGYFSIGICAFILGYLFVAKRAKAKLAETVSLALVFAGGLGNAVDRLTMGYVVDFIKCTFIDFPVFNFADIGVTCGVALFIISLLFSEAEHGPDAKYTEKDR